MTIPLRSHNSDCRLISHRLETHRPFVSHLQCPPSPQMLSLFIEHKASVEMTLLFSHIHSLSASSSIGSRSRPSLPDCAVFLAHLLSKTRCFCWFSAKNTCFALICVSILFILMRNFAEFRASACMRSSESRRASGTAAANQSFCLSPLLFIVLIALMPEHCQAGPHKRAGCHLVGKCSTEEEYEIYRTIFENIEIVSWVEFGSERTSNWNDMLRSSLQLETLYSMRNWLSTFESSLGARSIPRAASLW